MKSALREILSHKKKHKFCKFSIIPTTSDLLLVFFTFYVFLYKFASFMHPKWCDLVFYLEAFKLNHNISSLFSYLIYLIFVFEIYSHLWVGKYCINNYFCLLNHPMNKIYCFIQLMLDLFSNFGYLNNFLSSLYLRS